MAKKDKRYSKRGDYISLNSEDLNLIFFDLTKTNPDVYNKIVDTYLFFITEDSTMKNLSDTEILNKKIFIPNHLKYLRFNNEFDNFKDLYNYMNKNKNDSNIIPFLGEDTK